jgi:peptidoglycan/xylan/chitin deacetylase (PgdA/CDA1 family)
MWIVYFHNVVAGPLDELDRRLSRLSATEFASQVAFLCRHLRPVPLAELLSRHANGDDDPRAVAVTFDDGYRGVLTHAAPILAEAGIAAALFVVTETLEDSANHLFHFEEIEMAFRLTTAPALDLDLLGERLPLGSVPDRVRGMKRLKKRLKVLPEPERRSWHETVLERLGVTPRDCRAAAAGREAYAVLGRDELLRLQEAGWTLGAHTRTHRTLSCLDEAELQSEVAGCRDDLVGQLGLPGDLPFAYPYGGPEHVGPAAPAAVAAAGYGCAFTTVPARCTPASDRFLLPRMEWPELRQKLMAPAWGGAR